MHDFQSVEDVTANTLTSLYHVAAFFGAIMVVSMFCGYTQMSQIASDGSDYFPFQRDTEPKGDALWRPMCCFIVAVLSGCVMTASLMKYSQISVNAVVMHD